jgi:(p)ppGpp synthase/HD superfamily hydrolase
MAINPFTPRFLIIKGRSSKSRSGRKICTLRVWSRCSFAYSQAKTEEADGERLEKGTSFKLGNKYDLVKQLAGWKEQMFSEKETVKDFHLDALSHHIYVFSPKGDVYDLPENSTPVDYAFNVHSSLGFFIQTAKINNRIATIDAKLKKWDVAEIIKSKRSKSLTKIIAFCQNS